MQPISELAPPALTPSRFLGVAIRGAILAALVGYSSWVLGAFIVPIGGGLIHLLLVIAIISVIWHLINGRRVV